MALEKLNEPPIVQSLPTTTTTTPSKAGEPLNGLPTTNIPVGKATVEDTVARNSISQSKPTPAPSLTDKNISSSFNFGIRSSIQKITTATCQFFSKIGEFWDKSSLAKLEANIDKLLKKVESSGINNIQSKLENSKNETALVRIEQQLNTKGLDPSVEAKLKEDKTNLETKLKDSGNIGDLSEDDLSKAHDIAKSTKASIHTLNNLMNQYSKLVTKNPQLVSVDALKNWTKSSEELNKTSSALNDFVVYLGSDCEDPSKLTIEQKTFGLASVPLHVQMSMIKHCDISAIVDAFPQMRSNYQSEIPDKNPETVVKALDRDFARDISPIEIFVNNQELKTTESNKNQLLKEFIKSDSSINNRIDDLKGIHNVLNIQIKATNEKINEASYLLPNHLTEALNSLTNNLNTSKPDQKVSENIQILQSIQNLNTFPELEGFSSTNPDDKNTEIFKQKNNLTKISAEETDLISKALIEIKGLQRVVIGLSTKLTDLVPDKDSSIETSIHKAFNDKLENVESFKKNQNIEILPLSVQEKTLKSEKDCISTLKKYAISSNNTDEISNLEKKDNDITSKKTELDVRKTDAIKALTPYGLNTSFNREETVFTSLNENINFDYAIDLTTEIARSLNRSTQNDRDETIELLHSISLIGTAPALHILQHTFTSQNYAIIDNVELGKKTEISDKNDQLTSTNTSHFNILNSGNSIAYESKTHFDTKKKLCAIQVSQESPLSQESPSSSISHIDRMKAAVFGSKKV